MKSPEDMREAAERSIRLARQTIDDSVASALLAYACELQQRAYLLEDAAGKNNHEGRKLTRASP
jgi:hypothetical protein